MPININDVGNVRPVNNSEEKSQATEKQIKMPTKYEIADGIVDKKAGEAITSQGQALVNIHNSSEKASPLASKTVSILSRHANTDKLSQARTTVKKVPLPSNYKQDVIAGINAELESRYLDGTLSHKSAQKSANDILELSPVDLGARKAELMETYGDKFTEKKEAQKTEATNRKLRARFNSGSEECTNLMRNIRYSLSNGNFDFEGYYEAQKDVQEEIKLLRKAGLESGNPKEYIKKNFEVFLASVSDNGLVEIKDKEDEYSKSKLFGTLLEMINGEIETRLTTNGLSDKSAEEAAADILKLSPVDLGARKETLMEKYGDQLHKNRHQSYIDSQLSNKSATESAAVFEEEFYHSNIRKAMLTEEYGEAITAMEEKDLKPSQAMKYAAVKAKFPDIPEIEAGYFSTTLRKEMVELVLAQDVETFDEAFGLACEKWTEMHRK